MKISKNNDWNNSLAQLWYLHALEILAQIVCALWTEWRIQMLAFIFFTKIITNYWKSLWEIIILFFIKIMPLTHGLNTEQAILWKADSRILVHRLVLMPWPSLKRGFAKSNPFLSFWEGRRQKQVFEHYSAQNYLTVTKLRMGQHDLNTKIHFRRFWNFQF